MPSRRPLIVVAMLVVLSTALLLPFCKLQLDASVSFVAAMLSLVACFDLMSVYLLVGD